MLWKRNSFIAILIFSNSLALADDLAKQREALLKSLKEVHNLDESKLNEVKKIIQSSKVISQGNPKITKHPHTPEQCRAKLKDAKIDHDNASFTKLCGAKYMAPLYDPEKQKPDDAKVCIDQFEFPSIPCEYPVVWIKAEEAAKICTAMGKRLCDAHEWEGACEGQLLPPDYPFDKVKGKSGADAFRAMRTLHNQKWSPKKRWAYGATRKTGICAMDSTKDAACTGGDWQKCGSNTYPAGMFPDCSSPLKVYDIHGNAAEHMNLPTNPDEMASAGSKTLGHTEMKGSWFIWDKFQAHEDWCRWRAPYWHGTKVMSDHSHHNYHLGFRCCRDIK